MTRLPPYRGASDVLLQLVDIFSNWMGDNIDVSFGKVRLNYAEVGNTAPPLSVSDVYDLNTPYNGSRFGSPAAAEKQSRP